MFAAHLLSNLKTIMDIFSVSSTHHYCHSSPLSAAILAGKSQQISSSLTLSLQSSPEPNKPTNPPRLSGEIRHPQILKAFPSKPNPPGPKKLSTNPLRNLGTPSSTTPKNPDNLANKLWLSSKISPPLLEEETEDAQEAKDKEDEKSNVPGDVDSVHVSVPEFRQEGKIFVGNLPLWIKKSEFAEFFRQFGPIKNVILIKGHDDPERNVGYGFVIYGGPTAANSASKAVEFDGVEFHGRTLTVKLDDGRRLKARSEERARWVAGSDEVEYRSKWHEERDNYRREFRKVLESEPDNWQAAVRAFERIDKPSRREFGLLVNYYARRGDMHHAREVFERMLARGIEPTSHVYTNLIHAYAVGRDMEEALSCVRKMKREGIEMSLVTYSILVGGFGKIGDAEAADKWFKEAKERNTTLNAIIYGNAIYAHCQTGNMNRAEDLVREMEGGGIDAPIDIYHTMMDGYTNIGNEEKCLTVFERLKECGFTPSVISFGCLLNLYTKMEKAVEVLGEMSLAGISPNEHTYTIIMHGYASLGDTGKAFEYFTKIKEGGLEVDAFSYQALLKACCKSGRMQSALAVTREMSAQKIPRNTFVYNILIDGWARRGDVWEAADLMQQMRQEGVLPDIHTYTSFINACCKAGDMMRATEAIEEMEAVGVKPNVKTYTTLIHGWARASLPEKAFRCFEEMKLAGLKPDKAVYHCLMTSFLSRANVAEEYIYSGILGICREMVNLGLTVDMGTAVHWSRCLRKIERSGGDLTEALQKTFPPAWNSYVNLLEITNQTDSDGGGAYCEVNCDDENNGFKESDDLMTIDSGFD
ncbi:pentatricopeptide repeat-containing protein At5g04810, chloroplastic-like isoform X2 [Telopea speciosissima]|uniref:pentatricopeptide repeat-containing protein At5g04810, chloroplastic-like isoform X2 n=1 Tax=Telopea speciosissima TaxID=54955 RepID=UPI001CC7AAF4|nr:pentatricopeptide repeat-containing protein At5g04810, chloroplastic-like isoform X2 [Telopea speciosissima]